MAAPLAPHPPAPRWLASLTTIATLVSLAVAGCRSPRQNPFADAAAPAASSAAAPLRASQPAAPEASASAATSPARRPRGGLDVTFLVAADTHFGQGRPSNDDTPIDRSAPVGVELVHDLMVRQMRELPKRSWPPGLGGKVARPAGLIVAGDLTEDGSLPQWNRFLAWYGDGDVQRRTGIPLFETIGNHDRIRGDVIASEVARRHGAEFYSWDWGDLHVAVLGESPNDRSLAWLRDDLRSTGQYVPVVVVMHYPLVGPYSVDEWQGEGGPYDQFRSALQGYRVVGIFHGHYHAAGSYVWNDMDVYRVGSAKYVHHSFVVVRVTDRKMTVGAWNVDARAWWWWHDKRIDGQSDRGLLQVVPLRGIEPPLVER